MKYIFGRISRQLSGKSYVKRLELDAVFGAMMDGKGQCKKTM